MERAVPSSALYLLLLQALGVSGANHRRPSVAYLVVFGLVSCSATVGPSPPPWWLSIGPSPPPPLPPPPPPPPPPYAFTTTAALKTAVQAYNANPTAAIATYGPIVDWDVSAITDMSGLFYNLQNFDADISNWNTSGVTNMYQMFRVRYSPSLP